LIKINNLSYTYPQASFAALHQINWEVGEGEFVLLAGPSGSGKSTLLRCLNGLIPHFSGGTLAGETEVFGTNVVSAGPHVLSREIGFVAQDPEAQAVLDQVESEVAFSLENAAIPPAEMRVRVEEVLDLLDLTGLRGRDVQTLSGGERQRLAIAAALALRPRVLVLDEPTSQLDPQSAEDVLRALVRLNEDLGLTIILAEHRLERIIRYADRLTWLEAGRIVGDGPVRESLERIPAGPPLIQLARALEWRPLPLTIKEAKQFAASMPVAITQVEEAAPKSSAAEPLLEVKDLQFAYNGHPTLKNIDLTVRQGEAVALIGRNGAGKSTLLKCVVGLLQARAGDILIAGRSTRGRAVADICRQVGYLPQNPDDLLFAETVADELRVTLRNHHLSESPEDIFKMLRRLGLSESGHVYPRDLSVGQRQRVALGAVTVTQPPLLLLDEPTRGLDPALKGELVKLWKGWLADGAAILLVTHDVELAAMMADRTVMLSQGEVIASGPTRDVLGSSPHFSPQIARLFPGRGWLTVADALDYFRNQISGEITCPV
jgi:energy-coupling factor transporter ATP-binding protein EcfA2